MYLISIDSILLQVLFLRLRSKLLHLNTNTLDVIPIKTGLTCFDSLKVSTVILKCEILLNKSQNEALLSFQVVIGYYAWFNSVKKLSFPV